MNEEATLTKARSDADECRRLAELLHLDAVGILRAGGARRRVAWWTAPGAEVAPLDRILDGRAAGWVVMPRDHELVFAHLPTEPVPRSVSALTAMLGTLSNGGGEARAVELGGVAPEDPIERERTRLAYAIHDGLTQVVTASILELEWQARRADVTPDESVDALTTAATELRKALDEIRGVLANLSAGHEAPGQPLDELIRDVMERWQLPASWSVEGDLHALPEPVLDVASSVIRECVANAAKHADSRDIAVRVHASKDEIQVHIEDGGRGFEAGEIGLHAGHLGLEMMRRRVAALHGTLDIASSPGNGTRVVARLPVSEQGVRP